MARKSSSPYTPTAPTAWRTTAAAFPSVCIPRRRRPWWSLVFTRLHAGGKFDKGNGGAYSFSGGLHGVGVSVTNALATRLEVQVHRDGQVATLVFSGGDVIEPLKVRPLQAGERKQGTTVRAWPDAKYFESSAPPMGEIWCICCAARPCSCPAWPFR